MIAALLGWTKVPQWALELIVIAFVAFGVWYWQHSRFEAGIRQQQSSDAAALEREKIKAKLETAELEQRAEEAGKAYEQEHQDNVDYRRSNPIGVVRLCITPLGIPMPNLGTAHARNASASSTAANIQPMPSRNTGGGSGIAGPDIGAMLELLAGKADEVGNTLREFKVR